VSSLGSDSSSQDQKANPINSSNDIYLTIFKSTHHPTNKKPHECGVKDDYLQPPTFFPHKPFAQLS